MALSHTPNARFEDANSRDGASTSKRLRVLGYVRVSTDGQVESGAGIQAQREAIERECDARGYELAEVITDAGVSAATVAKRPGITRALAALDRGDVEALMVAKLDRLSRSMIDFVGLTERARRQGWSIVALDLGVDTGSPAGEMMANVLATFAQFERRLIGQRTREALAVKRATGVRLGRPPSALPEVVRDRIVAERAAGATLAGIARRLNADDVPTARGGRRWYPGVVAVIASEDRNGVGSAHDRTPG